MKVAERTNNIGLATKSYSSKPLGTRETTVKLHKREYKNVCFTLLKDLLFDVALGQDFMHLHKSVNIRFEGTEASLNLIALKALKTSSPSRLFQYLSKNCHPIVTKLRRHSMSDTPFIVMETKCLLLQGIIIKSRNSPWRALILIATNENRKERLRINHSLTIKKFTLLGGYPITRMQDVVRNVSQYNVISTVDLRSAYKQVGLSEAAKILTTFETDGQLY